MSKLFNFFKEKKDYIFIFLFSFLSKAVFTFIIPFLGIISDETSTLSGGALFAGLDWSNTVSNAGYYGAGMTALFAPLFKIINNPYVLYHVLLLAMCLLQSAIGIICYYLLTNHFGLKKDKISIVIAITASFIVTRRATNITNEHMLIFLCWLIVLLIVKIIQSKSKKEKDILSILIAITLGYSLTVHTRALTFIIAFFILYFIYLWIYRESLVSIIPFVISFTIFYFGAQIIINYVQNNNFALEYGLKLRNSYLPRIKLEDLLKPDSWYAWLSIIVGQVMTISVFSCGLFIVGIIITINMLWQGIIRDQAFIVNNNENMIRKKILSSLVFLFLCIGMTILMHSFTNVSSVMVAYNQGTGESDYGLKGITYIRYFGPYVGPVISLSIVYLYHYHSQLISIIKPSAVLISFISVIWVCCIVPFIYNSPVCKEAFFPLSLRFSSDASVGTTFYLFGVLILFILLGIITFLLFKKKYLLFALILFGFFSYEYSFNAIFFDRNMCQTNGTATSMVTYEYLKSFDFDKVDNKLYVYDASQKTDHQIYYTYQVLFKNQVIETKLPERECKKALLITDDFESAKHLLNYGYKVSSIENGNYVFIKGKDVEKQLNKKNTYVLFDNSKQYFGLEAVNDETNIISKSQEFDLKTGTYEFNFDVASIDIDKDASPMIRMYDAITNQTLSEYTINDLGEKKVYLSLYNDTKISIQFINSSSKQLLVNSPYYVEINNEVEIGINFNDEIEKIKQYKNIAIYSIRTDLSSKILNENINSNINVFNSIDELNGDYILCSKSDNDWMSLLPTYQLVDSMQDIVVLKKDVNSSLSYDNFAKTKVFEINQNEMTNSYSKLDEGEYCLDIDLLEGTDLKGNQFIINDSGNVVVKGLLEENHYARFECQNSINNWGIAIIDSNGNELNFEFNGISKTKDTKEYYKSMYMDSFEEDISTMSISSIGVYASNMCDYRNEGLLKSIDQRVEVYSESYLGNEDALLIDSNEIDLIFDKLTDYNIIGKYGNMTGLVKKQYNGKTLSNDEIVSAKYFNNNIILGSGTYKITFKTDILRKQDDYVGNIICNGIYKEIQANELEDGNFSITINSLDRIGQVKYSKEERNGSSFRANIISVERISKGYSVDLDLIENVKLEDNMIVSTKEDQQIQLKIPNLVKNTDYMLEVEYENQEEMTISVKDGDNVINYNRTYNSEKSKNGYVNKIELFSSIDCNEPYVEFKIPSNSKIKIKSVTLYYIKDGRSK